jgi:hypothetical protein
VRFTGRDGGTALLSNASRCFDLMGPPKVTTEELIDWTAEWVGSGGALLGRATSYGVTSGRF